MKFTSIALLAALAASASATPLRVYTLTSDPLPPLDEIKTLPIEMKKPCHGHSHQASGPLGSLLAKLGLARPSHRHGSGHGFDEKMESIHESLMDHFREHMNEVEDKVIPFLEGGSVRLHPLVNHLTEQESELTLSSAPEELKIWRYLEDDKWLIKSGINGEWRVPDEDEVPPKVVVHHNHENENGIGSEMEHPHRHGHGHGRGRWMAKTMTGRLHRALKNLKPIESICLAFVIGAGLGSIIHFFFMLFLLSFRYLRAGCPSREERRARRQARRERRKASGSVRFADQVEIAEQEELLPPYEAGAVTDVVVNEKAESPRV
ncbi:hypothetical protein I204_06695 [Kwoniella mangroviensis CBS 8886]|uniref:uncharacterized protein n=1 Tax=Kwoniella mangroviensis CBS 8507 TaxID=1296122 RepID=UPI00080D7C8A|nr:uncharacterized protein I203_01332 [Kwoniella mangroviensis CBS 8507]OCF69475.1 hypothetical protein I203_01332 [Kwoniella mangroviensis CBS 8507]OCF72316.1 hypothetical protein I204_06695 [Kwoniella mangroviensis CBS 8886]